MTHTPGPWQYAKGDSRLSIYREGLGDIASVGQAPYWQKFSEQDEADARLIAAAPDMLRALQELDAILDFTADFSPCECFPAIDGLRNAARMAAEALARAEGRTLILTQPSSGSET